LKPERWGSPLVQEKYQEEKACDKRHPYNYNNNNNNNNNNLHLLKCLRYSAKANYKVAQSNHNTNDTTKHKQITPQNR
jgi:hypothetical protein